MPGGGQPGSLNRIVVEFVLDEISDGMNGDVIAKVIAIDFHHSMVRAAPCASRWPTSADNDDTLCIRQYVSRTSVLRDMFVPGVDSCYADHIGAGIERDLLDALRVSGLVVLLGYRHC